MDLVLCKDCKEKLVEMKKYDYDKYIIEVKELGGKDNTKVIEDNNNFLDKLKKIQKRS